MPGSYRDLLIDYDISSKCTIDISASNNSYLAAAAALHMSVHRIQLVVCFRVEVIQSQQRNISDSSESLRAYRKALTLGQIAKIGSVYHRHC